MKENVGESGVPKREFTFEEQKQLAKDFVEIADNLSFINRDFNTFAEVGQHVDGVREEYDRMTALIADRRNKFNENVPNKRVFAEKLRETGEVELAEKIERLLKIN